MLLLISVTFSSTHNNKLTMFEADRMSLLFIVKAEHDVAKKAVIAPIKRTMI